MKLFRRSERLARSDLGPIWRILLNVLVIFIGSQLIAAFWVELGIILVGAPADSFDNSSVAQLFYVLIAEGLAAGAVLAIVKGRSLPFKTIGLGRRPSLKDIPYALLGFCAFYILLITVNVLLSFLSPDIDNGTQDVGFNHLDGALDSMIAFVALVFIPPLGEETLVRGYLYAGLRKKLRFLPALLATSLLFGAAHLGTGSEPGLLWVAGINTFVLSVVLVYLREKTGALYAGMLVHALNNAIAFGFHFHGVIF
jgi:membrane protease YdiL (CAAX protease family)